MPKARTRRYGVRVAVALLVASLLYLLSFTLVMKPVDLMLPGDFTSSTSPRPTTRPAVRPVYVYASTNGARNDLAKIFYAPAIWIIGLFYPIEVVDMSGLGLELDSDPLLLRLLR